MIYWYFIEKILRQKFFPRMWFYFRQGWTTYFAFIMAAVNTLTVTYYLAIENIPLLKEVFPSFVLYIVLVTGIGIPLLIFIGHAHFKKTSVYGSESDITAESYPYNFKLTPGVQPIAQFPVYLVMLELLEKLIPEEKFTENDKQKIENIRETINKLIEGGFVGNPPKGSI